MPTTPRRREPRVRRRLPPRPTYHDAPLEVTAATAATEDTRVRLARERALAVARRDSRYLAFELKRIVGVTATCLGMLAVLAVIQRMAS